MKITSPTHAPTPGAAPERAEPCKSLFKLDLESRVAAAPARPADPRPAGPLSAPSPVESGAKKLLTRILDDERAVDGGLRAAMSGQKLSAQELLVLQAKVIQYSQELEVASRIVEKGTSAVKQVMTTQV